MQKNIYIKREVLEREMTKRDLMGGEVAKALGISHTYFSLIKNGKRPVNCARLRKRLLLLFHPIMKEEIFF